MAKSKHKRRKRPPGRPVFVIDLAKVDALCRIQCTGEEVAAVLDIDYDTLNAALVRQTGKRFSDYFAQKSQVGKMSLRRAQYQAALAGDRTMLVWLGKNLLGQRDVYDHNVNANARVELTEITIEHVRPGAE